MGSSTLNIENHKNFDYELEFIENICSSNRIEVGIIGRENVKANFTRTHRIFNLEINERIEQDWHDDISLSFSLNDKIYYLKNTGSISNGANFVVDRPPEFQVVAEIRCFHSDSFSLVGKFKEFYCVSISDVKTFHDQFETVTHSRGETRYFYDCLRITVNGKEYDVVQLKHRDKGYYVFECLQEQSFEAFSEACFSIKQAIGFINKLMVGGEMFVFDEKKNFHYSNNSRPILRGMYSPLTTNPYSYPEIEQHIADNFHPKLTRISLDCLSRLATKIHDEIEFSTAILVIMEASSLRSLLILPSSFSVIIEQLSKHFSTTKIGSETPITSVSLRNAIVNELHEVIDRHDEKLGGKTSLLLKRRINELNKPINRKRLTNNEKLTRPFEQLGIDLSLHDIKIIEHRNDLLHGNILLQSENQKDIRESNLYMGYVSAKLFTLISKLILKSVGYDGYVYNQAKRLEKYLNIVTEEEFFEKI